MKVSGWGRYPTVDASIEFPASLVEAGQMPGRKGLSSAIVRGLGRSYGDSALAEHIVSTSELDHFISFDSSTGLLRCATGTSLADILDVFVHKGWFLPVTPGTKFVTIGGAIASDVHGKNHHVDGTFTEHVESIEIATVSEGILECSRNQHPELFHATCGGMGLTGIILSATIKLIPIKSAQISETTIKATDLQHSLELCLNHAATYSVAWIDCLATGGKLGRSLVMLGEHATEGSLVVSSSQPLNIPVDMPGIILNRFSIQAFNTLYYHRITRNQISRTVHYDPYFYPLDSIGQWNRLYGKKGFLQYQFALPLEAGYKGMKAILERIAASKKGSFLAVLKAFGKSNSNYLSFPIEGYTLALDFKIDRDIFAMLDELDRMVLDFGGRIYLAKDARMNESTFKQSYPNWEEFQKIRESYGAHLVFNSAQSKRLGIA